MSPDRFQFQQFSVHHGPGALKVTTDACFLGALVEPGEAMNMADLGAGTGLLSLMAAQKAALGATIHAVENNLEAFGYLVENVQASPFASIIQPHPAEVLRFAEGHTGKIDLIFANPPFFRGIKRKNDEGLNAALHMHPALPRAWTEAAAAMLRPGGKLYIMWPPDQMQSWLPIATEMGLGLVEGWSLAHSRGHQPIRMVALVEKGASSVSNQPFSPIFVRQKDNALWSPEFYRLLRGYYLGIS